MISFTSPLPHQAKKGVNTEARKSMEIAALDKTQFTNAHIRFTAHPPPDRGGRENATKSPTTKRSFKILEIVSKVVRFSSYETKFSV